MGKRVFDMVFSALGLMVLSPVFALISVAIKIDSVGPVFYRGLRIGLDGKPFKIFKFRSMVQQAENMGTITASEHDIRITRIGHMLRRYKLDELPQLLNVLIGDMSLVGPRPEVSKWVQMFSQEEKAILSIKPGITDWSSIRFRNQGEIIEASGYTDADEAFEKIIRPEKIRLQLCYVHNNNLWIDAKIIFDTICAIVRRGSHHEK